jgi:hypothetical protein
MLDHANATFIKPVTFAASDIVPGRVKNEVFQRFLKPFLWNNQH